MEQQANYIRRIEIHGLWERFNIGWDLRPDVNILSGINGVGKTTILNRSVGYLEELSGEMKSDEKNGVRLFFDNPQATYIPYDVIRSYDRPLIMGTIEFMPHQQFRVPQYPLDEVFLHGVVCH